jgi:glycosyltransferase involved in cell wall biosynthesis
LKNLGNQYCLLAVGRGSEDEYVQLAENEGVSKRCFFLQSIKNEELARYYSWADCMCTPSLWEGFGVVFIEALASEAVVVTSDIAPMNEFIKNGINGLLVKDYTDPISLAKTIKLACEDVQLRAVLKKNARKSVEIFEKHKVDKLEVDYYAKVLSMPKPVESNMLVKERITAYINVD